MDDDFLTNNLERAVAKNYFDDGNRYYYRICEGGHLQYKVVSDSDEILFEWDEFRKNNIRPRISAGDDTERTISNVIKVAADNNRVFIQTEDLHLYWRCLKEDSASWVLVVFTILELIGSVPEGIDSETAQAAEEFIFNALSEKPWVVEGEIYHDLGDWANQYRTWVDVSHKAAADGGGWNSLADRCGINFTHIEKTDTQTNDFSDKAKEVVNNVDSVFSHSGLCDPYIKVDDSTVRIRAQDIIDIAVGNWNGVVISYYILAKVTVKNEEVARVFFIDEEELMFHWELVPAQNGLPFNCDSRIYASHSVVAVTTGNLIHWIRFDAHTNDHVPLFPINWNEAWVGLDEKILDALPFDTAPTDIPYPFNRIPPFDMFDEVNYPNWHRVVSPIPITAMHFDVSYKNRPWPVPKPPRTTPLEPYLHRSIPWTLHIIVAIICAFYEITHDKKHTEIGILGDNPIKPNCHYPVCCIVESGDRLKGFWIHFACQAVADDSVDWVDIEPQTHASIENTTLWRTFKNLTVETCNRSAALGDRCRRLTEDICVEEADQGYERCAREEERAHRECCDWWPCSVLCDVWILIRRLACVAWVWVSNVVCVTWRTIVRLICRPLSRLGQLISCWARSCWTR